MVGGFGKDGCDGEFRISKMGEVEEKLGWVVTVTVTVTVKERVNG